METKIKNYRLSRLGEFSSKTYLQLAYTDSNGMFYGITESKENLTKDMMEKGVLQFSIPFNQGESHKIISIDLTQYPTTHANYHQVKRNERYNELLNNHPHVDTATKTAKYHFFKLTDIDEEKNASVLSIKNTLAIGNRINSMTNEEINTLCAYLNYNTGGKSEIEIYVELLKEKTVTTNSSGYTYETQGLAYTMADRVLNFENDAKAKLIVFCNKAVMLGIIEIKDGNYFHSGHMIATSDESLYVYFEGNNTLFENGIVKSVREKDNLLLSFNTIQPISVGIEKMEDIKESNSIFTTDAEELIYLRNKAILLGVKGYQIMKLETLKTAIKNKEDLTTDLKIQKDEREAIKSQL